MNHSSPKEPWKDLGIAGRSRISGLLYNGPADRLVAIVNRELDEGPPVTRLYYRRPLDTMYRPVEIWHEMESQQDPQCCERRPFLLFNEWRFRESEPTPVHLKWLGIELPDRPFGADWVGIRRFNLATGEDDRILDHETIKPFPPYTEGWVSRLMSVTADASVAVCSVGLTPGEGVDYYVCELSLADGSMSKRADLPRVFL